MTGQWRTRVAERISIERRLFAEDDADYVEFWVHFPDRATWASVNYGGSCLLSEADEHERELEERYG